jgi:glycosyltransferase involved in cell wall biosynthesis
VTDSLNPTFANQQQPTPVVSVAITAYNSAQWLARALDSVLMQQTAVPVEIVVGDDCSQDHTVQVARDYAQSHPTATIRVLARANNVGIQRNYYETFENCRGKYIAWLDADDYWTDPQKLAIQVQTMEADPTITLCGHYMRVVGPDGSVKQTRTPSTPPGVYGVDAMLHTCFLPSVSAIFRNGIQLGLPPWYFDLAPVTEWPIWILAAVAGKVVMLDRIMADYMHTPGSSAWSKGSLFTQEREAAFLERVESILPTRWIRLARAEKGKRYEEMAYFLRREGDFPGSRAAALKAFRSPALFDNLGSKTKALVAAVVREAEWKLHGEAPQT